MVYSRATRLASIGGVMITRPQLGIMKPSSGLNASTSMSTLLVLCPTPTDAMKIPVGTQVAQTLKNIFITHTTKICTSLMHS